MPQLRQNIVSREWVIITDKKVDPAVFCRKSDPVVLPEYSKSCPFCAGNEDKTPEELFRVGFGKSWSVRVFPNKSAVLSRDCDNARSVDGVFRWINGFGMHEVIVEHPRHNSLIALMTTEEIADILRVYKNRYVAAHRDKRVEAVTIFKNHGGAAGTALEHTHSQLIATPIVPPQVRRRIEYAANYFDDTGKCIFCRCLEEEVGRGERLIAQTAHFTAFIPYAALSPFHTWIFPSRHMACFSDINESEIRDLAKNLKIVFSKIYHGLGNPDFNFSLRSLLDSSNGAEYFHWYLTLVPRVEQSSGFELGSGMFINNTLPEKCAEFLRSAASG
jgi:UDPglucose--hexose-1-phosphate uridylyltransferase